jgi:flagellar assembly protein FliH
LYRLVARQGLKEDEVRPFQHDLIEDQFEEAGNEGEAGTCRSVEFQSLDLLQLGPHLLLLAAQEKAQEIVAEAGVQAEQIRDLAAAQGALEEREKTKQELVPSLTALANAGQMLIILEQQMISRYTPQLVRLALEIAERIVGKSVAEEPQIVATVLERAKREVVEAREIRILLHPADHELLAEIRPDLVRSGEENGRTIEIVPSAEVSHGGCRLETEIGMVDATIPIQLAEIHRQLLDEDGNA